AAPVDLGRAVRRRSPAGRHGRAPSGHRVELDAGESVRVPQLLAAARRSGAARGELSLGGSRDGGGTGFWRRAPRLRAPAAPGRSRAGTRGRASIAAIRGARSWGSRAAGSPTTKTR